MEDIDAVPSREETPPRWRSVDPARLLPRWLSRGGSAAAAGRSLLVAVGGIILVAAPFLGATAEDWLVLGLVSAGMVAAVGVSLLLPWQRWSPWATLAFPLSCHAGLTVIGLATESLGSAYVAVLSLWFVYLGMHHRPMASVLLLVPSCATYFSMITARTSTTGVRVVLYAVVWLFISAILTRMMDRQHAITEQLREATRTDALTAIGNRRGLDLRLAQLAPGDCVVLIDLDHFKAVNDAAGHAAGDRVLESFGAVVGQMLRRRDYAARYGGDEFVLVLAKTTPKQAAAALESLRCEWSELGTGVTFSAGIAAVADCPVDAVLAAADAALYDAKKARRGTSQLAQGPEDAEAAPSGGADGALRRGAAGD